MVSKGGRCDSVHFAETPGDSLKVTWYPGWLRLQTVPLAEGIALNTLHRH